MSTTTFKEKEVENLLFEQDASNSNIVNVRAKYNDGTVSSKAMQILTFDKKKIDEFINIKVELEDTPYFEAKKYLMPTEDEMKMNEKGKVKAVISEITQQLLKLRK